jgi:hypothetical protein
MWRTIFAALAVLTISGCATVSKTATYQVAEWQEVEVPQPVKMTVVQDAPAVEAVEDTIEVPQPAKELVVQVGIPQKFPGAKPGRKYLNIGYKPVNPNRVLPPEGVEFILPEDAYVETIDRDGKHSRGWLLAGERVVGIPSHNPDFYKAVWIRRCGNDLFNEEKIAIFIRVKKEIVPQPSVKAKMQRPAQAAKTHVESVSQPPLKQAQLVQVTKTRELTCRERKAEVSWLRKGLSYVVTGVVGTGGALLGGAVSRSPHGVQVGAGLGVLVGRLIGGYTDGSECIDGDDVAQGVMLGITAGFIAPTNAPRVTGGSAPNHSLPGNGGGNTLPSNGGGSTIYAPPVNPITGHSLPIN